MSISRYTATAANLSPGWHMQPLLRPSALYGANGMRIGPDDELYVAQAFGSQVSALNTSSAEIRTVIPVGSDVVAPDDLAFDSHGVMYMTEVMSERVSARLPNGSTRVIADNVPVANGITIHDDRIFMDEFRVGGRIFELFPDGRAPRLIADNLVMPNALAMGPDGALYFPQVATGEIWRVAASGGTPERVIDGLALPTAVKFSPAGELFTTEGGSGDITRIDIQAGTRHVVAKVRPGIDNFAFASDGRMFVSHFVDGGVAEIEAGGNERVMVDAGLLGPFGISSAPDGTLYIADGMSLAVVDENGNVTARPALLVDQDFPGFVRGAATNAAGECYVTTTGGTVAHYSSGANVEVIVTGLDSLGGIAITADGSLLVCEPDSGRVLQVGLDGTVTTLARGLKGPAAIAASENGTCFVSEATNGQVVHIGQGETTSVISGLTEPHGLALHGENLFVLDRGAKSLLRYSCTNRESDVIATALPVGAAPGITPKVLPGIADVLPGPLLPFADLTITGDGRILLGADGDGGIYALTQDPV